MNGIKSLCLGATLALPLGFVPASLAQRAAAPDAPPPPPPPAQAGQGQGHGQARLRALVGEQDRSIEVRVEDGQVRVFRNGEEVDRPAERLMRLAEEARAMAWESQPAPKTMIGIHMAPPHPALEKHLGLERGTATMIVGLLEGLPAHAAGLGEFDIIVKVNGESPADVDTVRKVMAEREPGDEVRLTVIQEGKQRDVTVKLIAHDREAMRSAKLIGRTAPDGDQLWRQFLPGGGGGEFRGTVVAPSAPRAPGAPSPPRVFVAPGEGAGTREFRELREFYGPEVRERLDRADRRLQQMEQAFRESARRRLAPGQDRDRIEERLDRLERMLEQLLEQQERDQ